MSITDETWNKLHEVMVRSGTCLGCGSVSSVHAMACVYSDLLRGYRQTVMGTRELEATIKEMREGAGANPLKVWKVELEKRRTSTVFVRARVPEDAVDASLSGAELATWGDVVLAITGLEEVQAVPEDGVVVG